MKQGVPDNRFNVCEEHTFSRTFRKKSTERNKQDLNSQLNDIFITNQCYSFHIKDQGVVQIKLRQLLQHRSKSPEGIKRMKTIMTKMKQDRRYLKMKTPGCCAFQQLSFLALLHLHSYSAAKILRAIICQFGITFIK